ncbi:hypothetical protein [Micromonospora sp. URMC 103]|uniref:hypothetical protein n=1 Tax=Micromonospora sp. URMC 103 TaxID=3423406 RepID=UPI003F1A94D8
MSPAAAEAVVLDHLAADLPFLSDEQLTKLAAEHAVETGHYAAEARRLIDREFEYRQAVRRAHLAGAL